jgi:hypothetical protein
MTIGADLEALLRQLIRDELAELQDANVGSRDDDADLRRLVEKRAAQHRRARSRR